MQSYSSTKILSPTTENIVEAAEILCSGGNVAFPTETVYGLGACVFNDIAVRKIFLAKGRPSDNPLIVHCAEKQDIERIADLSHLSEKESRLFHALYEAFCPGPLTFVLPKQTSVPDSVTAGLSTVAVRFPKHPVAEALIRAAGEPLVAPSANRSGYPSPTTAAHVLDDLADRIEAIMDGGVCEVGIESTVVNILVNPPCILRPGNITKEQLDEIALSCGHEKFVYVSADETLNASQNNTALPSPGMKYRHYAPKARVILVSSAEEARDVMQTIPYSRIFREKASNSNTSGYAVSEKNLYAELRKADDDGLQAVIIIVDEALRKNVGLMNRLSKASEGS